MDRKLAPAFRAFSQGAALAVALGVGRPVLGLDVYIQPGASVQSAINQVNTAGGGSVFLSSGNYALTTTLLIKSNVRLVGAGQGMTSISYSNDDDVIRQNSEGLSNVTIEGLTVIGSNTTNCMGILIESLGTYHTNINIINCEITSCGMGMHIKRAYGVTVSGCNLYGNGCIGLEGYYHNLYIRQCDGTQSVNVVNCQLNNSITANGLNLSYNRNVFVSGCTANNNYFRGMRAADTVGFSVRNCITSGNGDRGLLANTEVNATQNINWQMCVANSNRNNGIDTYSSAVTGSVTGCYAHGNTPNNFVIKSGVTSSGNSSALFFAPPPPVPAALTAAAGNTGINLSWSPSAGAIYYNVKYSTVIGGPYITIARGLTNTTYTSIGLPFATNHHFAVSAWAMGGESANSSPVLFTNPPSIKWVGDGVANLWDTAITTNWFNTSNSAASVFQPADQVTFDDTGSRSPAVSLFGSLAPGIWTVKTTNTYQFAGTGNITGNAALNVNGSGTVLLNHSGSNDFTGGININAGTLRIGANNTSGNLPATGEVVNNGTLIFSRTDNLTVRNRISGSGSVSKGAAGTLTLASSNSYSGATIINGGKVVVGTNGALPSLSVVTLGDLTGPANLDLLTASTTIGGLLSGTTNAAQTNTITIGVGQTLTVAGDFKLGVDASGTLKLNVAGAGTLNCRNGSIQIGGAVSGTFQNTATLDLSSLRHFTTDVGSFNIGDTGGSTGNTGPSTVILASNNIVKATSLNIIGSHGGAVMRLRLGRGTNLLQLSNLGVGYGSGRASGDLHFNSASGSLMLRDASGGTNGTLAIGGAIAGNNTGADLVGVMDVTGHQADIAVGTLSIGDRAGGNTTSGGASGTLSFDTGTLAATTVKVGSRTGGTAVKTITGTLNISGGVANLGNTVLATNSTGVGNVTGALNLTGGTVTMSGNITKGGGAATTASVTLNDATLDMRGGAIGGVTNIDTLNVLSGTLANVGQINNGVGGLNKTGSGTLLLRGMNTFGGGTFITAGTLGGDGRVNGAVSNLATGILRPGLGGSDTSTLTISNTLGLAGQTLFVLNRTNAQNSSRIEGVTMLTLGGTLTVSNTGTALQAGDAFTLFDAASTTGTFAATNLPALPLGLGWANQISSNGSIAVVATVNTTPTKMVATVSGGVLTLTWPMDHTGWLLQSNSVGLHAPGAWFHVPGSDTTNAFNIPIHLTQPQVFYRLTY